MDDDEDDFFSDEILAGIDNIVAAHEANKARMLIHTMHVALLHPLPQAAAAMSQLPLHHADPHVNGSGLMHAFAMQRNVAQPQGTNFPARPAPSSHHLIDQVLHGIPSASLPQPPPRSLAQQLLPQSSMGHLVSAKVLLDQSTSFRPDDNQEIARLRLELQAANRAKEEWRQKAEREQQERQRAQHEGGGPSVAAELQRQLSFMQQQLIFVNEEVDAARRRGSDRDAQLHEAIAKAAAFERDSKRKEEQLAQLSVELRMSKERAATPFVENNHRAPLHQSPPPAPPAPPPPPATSHQPPSLPKPVSNQETNPGPSNEAPSIAPSSVEDATYHQIRILQVGNFGFNSVWQEIWCLSGCQAGSVPFFFTQDKLIQPLSTLSQPIFQSLSTLATSSGPSLNLTLDQLALNLVTLLAAVSSSSFSQEASETCAFISHSMHLLTAIIEIRGKEWSDGLQLSSVLATNLCDVDKAASLLSRGPYRLNPQPSPRTAEEPMVSSGRRHIHSHRSILDSFCSRRGKGIENQTTIQFLLDLIRLISRVHQKLLSMVLSKAQGLSEEDNLRFLEMEESCGRAFASTLDWSIVTMTRSGTCSDGRLLVASSSILEKLLPRLLGLPIFPGSRFETAPRPSESFRSTRGGILAIEAITRLIRFSSVARHTMSLAIVAEFLQPLAVGHEEEEMPDADMDEVEVELSLDPNPRPFKANRSAGGGLQDQAPPNQEEILGGRHLVYLVIHFLAALELRQGASYELQRKCLSLCSLLLDTIQLDSSASHEQESCFSALCSNAAEEACTTIKPLIVQLGQSIGSWVNPISSFSLTLPMRLLLLADRSMLRWSSSPAAFTENEIKDKILVAQESLLLLKALMIQGSDLSAITMEALTSEPLEGQGTVHCACARLSAVREVWSCSCLKRRREGQTQHCPFQLPLSPWAMRLLESTTAQVDRGLSATKANECNGPASFQPNQACALELIFSLTRSIWRRIR